eukprot:1105063-Prorocentrum_minimum.AAC.1
MVRSETVEKSTHPKWTSRPVQLGYVHASTMKMVKIRLFDEDTLSQDDFLGEVRIPGKTRRAFRSPCKGYNE